MKALILALSLFSTASAFANTPAIKACNEKGLSYLEDFIEERAADEEISARYMKNANDQVVGVYIWSQDGASAYGQICEIIDVPDDSITASTWYYWESETSSNPSAWPVDTEYSIAQDEGRAYLKVLAANADGDISFEFRVIGWAETEDEIVFRSEVLHFAK